MNKLRQPLLFICVDSYQLSNRENHTTAEYEEEDSSDDENNLNLTMIDEEFSHNDDGRDASS